METGGTTLPMTRRLLVTLALAMLAGCAPGTTFVYKPGPPEAGGLKLPVKIAVLPFEDGTGEFKSRRSASDPKRREFNLVQSAIPGTTTALTPELLAKAFADDLAASGGFRSVRFVFSMAEIADEDLLLGGTVEKASYSGPARDRTYGVAIAL